MFVAPFEMFKRAEILIECSSKQKGFKLAPEGSCGRTEFDGLFHATD